MEPNTMIFNLSKTIEYSKKGEFEKAASFEFSAPGMPEFKKATRLAQLVMGSIIGAKPQGEQPQQNQYEVQQSTGEAQKTMGDMAPDELKAVFFMSQAVDFDQIAEAFDAVAVMVGTVDGETKLTRGIFNKMEMSDYVSMICEFCLNFTIPSLFSGEGR